MSTGAVDPGVHLGLQADSSTMVLSLKCATHGIGKVYLRVPPNAPVKRFWPQTVRSGNNACIISPTCGGALMLEHNGDVYSCDHCVEPDHRLGITSRCNGHLVHEMAGGRPGWT